MNNKKIKLAFSLAEALIALLVVCMIVAASVPMLKKKKVEVEKSAGGFWMCTLDENGRHVTYSSINKTWSNSGSECVFVPPKGARNFEVVAVGGGGGGGAGLSQSASEKVYGYSYGNSKYFTAPATGDYELVLIGGGGAGGSIESTICVNRGYIAGSGGSGGFLKTKVRLYKGSTYYLYAGKGGSSTSYNDKASPGESSYIKQSGYSYNMNTASGGTGGNGVYRRILSSCSTRCRDPQGSKYGCRGDGGFPYGEKGSFYTAEEGDIVSTPGALCRSASTVLSGSYVGGMNCNTLLTNAKYLGEYNGRNIRVPDTKTSIKYALPFGYGGAGQDNIDSWTQGGPGIVLLNYNNLSAGEGGKAGYPYRPSAFPTIKKLKATIGAGGKGASGYNNATAGGRTQFWVETQDREKSGSASGGVAGQSNYENSVDENTSSIVGKNGEASEVKTKKDLLVGGLGGLVSGNSSVDGQDAPVKDQNYFGAGGGGAGADSSGSGSGGDGAPGAVIVRW